MTVMAKHTLVTTLSETFSLGLGGDSDFSLLMENFNFGFEKSKHSRMGTSHGQHGIQIFHKDGLLVQNHLELHTWDASFFC